MVRFFKNDIFSCPGDKVVDIYSPVVTEDGHIDVEVSGKEDLNAYIQSFRESCDMDCIMRRYMNGELDAFNKVVGTYGDFTDAPKSYAEFLQLQIDAAKAFNSLKPEIRQNFNNDLNEFISSLGTDNWFKSMNININKEEVVKEEGEKVE